MSSRLSLAWCAALLFLTACAGLHRGPPAVAGPGFYSVERVRAHLGSALVELGPDELVIERDGERHRYAETGTLLLARDGSCRLLLDLTIDGTTGHAERTCSFHSSTGVLLLDDHRQGTRTVYRVSQRGTGLWLEAEASGEALLLAPQVAAQPVAGALAGWQTR